MGRIVRPALFGIAALLVLAIPVGGILARSYFLAPTWQEPPDQPINFPHTIHVQTVGLDCVFCHRGATDSPHAMIAALEQCMQCHQVIPTANRPQLELLVAAFENGEPIEWNRVYQMPDHVRFVHMMHIEAGFDCSECHGEVAEMGPEGVRRARDLRMGDCVECHKQNGARTDCAACHY